MKVILKVSFIGHLLIFISTFVNLTEYIQIDRRLLLYIIYSTYICDIFSCYKGIIPFYRCNNTQDIYTHHLGALSILTMTLPSLFTNNPVRNKLINRITDMAFVSSLNEAIMVYGTSYKMTTPLTAFELMYKVYLFSFHALMNAENKIKLIKMLTPNDKLLYMFCVSGLSFYIILYPKLLKGSVSKLYKLIQNGAHKSG